MFNKPVSKTENAGLRHRAKAINFGLVYGMGANGLARTMQCDLPEARKLLDGYFNNFPEIGKFLDYLARTGIEQGFAKSLSGRRLYLDAGTSSTERAAAERIAKNMPIQGSSADMTKIALACVHGALARFTDTGIVNAVHDEIVVECSAHNAEAVRDTVVAEMKAAAEELLKRIPIEVDACITQAWDK